MIVAGNLPAKELQKTDVDILDNGQCNKKLRPRMKSSGWHGLNQQICATNLVVQTDACQVCIFILYVRRVVQLYKPLVGLK